MADHPGPGRVNPGGVNAQGRTSVSEGKGKPAIFSLAWNSASKVVAEHTQLVPPIPDRKHAAIHAPGQLHISAKEHTSKYTT